MASQYRINPRAITDLDLIWSYVSTHSERAADNLADDIFLKIEMLLQFPLAGRERTDLMPGLRSFAVGSHTIFYRVKEGLEILRVIHGSQDITEDDFI